MYLIFLDSQVNEDDLKEFEKKVDETLAEVFQKYDIKYQIDEANAILKKEYEDLDGIVQFKKFLNLL